MVRFTLKLKVNVYDDSSCEGCMYCVETKPTLIKLLRFPSPSLSLSSFEASLKETLYPFNGSTLQFNLLELFGEILFRIK